MLNPFPELLVYGFFAPTLLRFIIAFAFFYVAYRQYQRRGEIARLHFPLVGHGSWIAWLAVTFHALVGLALLLGWYTQIAALVAALGLIKGMWLNKRYPSLVVLPQSTIIILIAISLSLLITGAGAFAFDLPL